MGFFSRRRDRKFVSEVRALGEDLSGLAAGPLRTEVAERLRASADRKINDEFQGRAMSMLFGGEAYYRLEVADDIEYDPDGLATAEALTFGYAVRDAQAKLGLAKDLSITYTTAFAREGADPEAASYVVAAAVCRDEEAVKELSGLDEKSYSSLEFHARMRGTTASRGRSKGPMGIPAAIDYERAFRFGFVLAALEIHVFGRAG